MQLIRVPVYKRLSVGKERLFCLLCLPFDRMPKLLSLPPDYAVRWHDGEYYLTSALQEAPLSFRESLQEVHRQALEEQDIEDCWKEDAMTGRKNVQLLSWDPAHE